MADLLGLHINTASAWTRHAATDWVTYLAARIDNPATLGRATTPAANPDQ